MTQRRISSGGEVFRLLVENVEDFAMCAMDLQGRIVYWNVGAVITTGYSEQEVLGRPLDFLFTDEDAGAGIPAQEIKAAAEHGRAEDERWHVRKDGARFWALGLLVAVHDDSGDLVGFGKILRDRTDIKEMQDALRNRATSLAQADEDKKVFLATLAHELRNPLSVLMNGVALIMRADSLERIRATAQMMERQIVHSKRLVEDLLESARIGRNKLQLARAPIDIREVLPQAMENAIPDPARHGLSVHCELPGTPIIVSGDRERLHQVFVNLLTNAAKFTKAGGRITATATKEGDEAVIRIEDTGVGIPPEKLPAIFELFSQVHSGPSDSARGLGIGLALTRDLVALHGGTIQARSSGKDAGSEFIVRLPLSVGEQTIRPES